MRNEMEDQLCGEYDLTEKEAIKLLDRSIADGTVVASEMVSPSKKYSKGRRKIQQQVSTLRDWSASATQSHMERRPL